MQLSNLFHGSKLSFQVKHQIPQRPTFIAPGTYPSVSLPVGKAAPTHCLEMEGIQKRYWNNDDELYRPVAKAPPCSTCPVGGEAQHPTTLLLKERKEKPLTHTQP